MKRKRPIFHLYILGHIADITQPQFFITFAEFQGARAIERIQVNRPQVERLAENIRNLRAFIEAGFPPFERTSLEQLGSELFDLIIRGNVKRLFDRATGPNQEILPFEIYLEDFGIASWPWEYLYDSSTRVFLCQEFHPISRGIFSLSSWKLFPPKEEKVRILLLIGVLPDDPGTTPEEEIKWIQEVFNSELATETVDIKIMQAIEPIELRRELQTNTYDILHFFGHARFDDNRKEGYLKLERPNTEPHKFYANDFSQLLSGRNIRLVFLNACETARSAQNSDPARSSIAAAILERGIPAVIATQFSIPDTSAHFLSSMVYNALVTGKPLVEAMLDGRQAMSHAEKGQFFDWGIPVLYSSDPELVIFPQAKDKQQPKWVKGFERASKSSSMIKKLREIIVTGGPSIIVERTAQSPNKDKAKVRVALVDLDSKAGFLPELIEAANLVQFYYDFQVAYLPLPSGAIRIDFEKGKAPPQIFLPRIDKYFSTKPKD